MYLLLLAYTDIESDPEDSQHNGIKCEHVRASPAAELLDCS